MYATDYVVTGYRERVYADTEQTRRAHQPDLDGRCGNCRDPWPCGPLRFAEYALDALDRRGVQPPDSDGSMAGRAATE